MYDQLINFIGISPNDDIIGFTICCMLIMFVVFQVFQLLYTILKG